MTTIIYSIIGIIVLVGISFLFSYLGDSKSKRTARQLDVFRRKLVLSGKKGADKNHERGPVSPRYIRDEQFNIFPTNGDTPVL